MHFSRFDTIRECHGQTNRQTTLLYQYRPLLSCLNAESCFKNMHLRDRRCVRTLHPLFVYATVDDLELQLGQILLEFRDISLVSKAITAKRMKIDP